MRDDRPSSTAAIVAAARAIVQKEGTVEGFSDDYASRLLPASYRRAVRNVAFRKTVLPGAHLFALRTVAIDEGIRRASARDQLVILGAGLDARAWRLPELAETAVFEVDHPSTQRYKRERVDEWERHPGHRFVAVDFERDSLDARLREAGHDPARPTIWIWEGVTMYLHPPAIEATLGTVSERSAAGSRLLVTYIQPSLTRKAVGTFTRLVGEPVVSQFTPKQMASLLARFDFQVVRDESSLEWHTRWAAGRLRLPKFALDTERLATADRQ